MKTPRTPKKVKARRMWAHWPSETVLGMPGPTARQWKPVFVLPADAYEQMIKQGGKALAEDIPGISFPRLYLRECERQAALVLGANGITAPRKP